jgi:hypothetical protein
MTEPTETTYTTDRLERELVQLLRGQLEIVRRGDSPTGIYETSLLLDYVADGGERFSAFLRIVDHNLPVNISAIPDVHQPYVLSVRPELAS